MIDDLSDMARLCRKVPIAFIGFSFWPLEYVDFGMV